MTTDTWQVSQAELIYSLEAQLATERANKPSLGHDGVLTFPDGSRWVKV